MSFSMYDATVPVYRRALKGVSAVLTKAAAHAETRKIDPGVLLNWRLAPDMFPLIKQVQIAADHAKGGCARLAKLDVPVIADTENSFTDLQARIAKTLSYIETFKPEQFAGAEDRNIVMELGPNKEFRLEFVGRAFLSDWSLPNFYFHVTTAYAILRQAGVDIGKRDFLAAEL